MNRENSNQNIDKLPSDIISYIIDQNNDELTKKILSLGNPDLNNLIKEKSIMHYAIKNDDYRIHKYPYNNHYMIHNEIKKYPYKKSLDFMNNMIKKYQNEEMRPESSANRSIVQPANQRTNAPIPCAALSSSQVQESSVVIPVSNEETSRQVSVQNVIPCCSDSGAAESKMGKQETWHLEVPPVADNDRMSTDDENLKCPVCLENKKNAVIDCGHMMCIPCCRPYALVENPTCPTCRWKMTKVIKCFI